MTVSGRLLSAGCVPGSCPTGKLELNITGRSFDEAAGLVFAALTFAQRSLAAAAMRARPAALIPPFLTGLAGAALVSVPKMAASCFSRPAIFSLRFTACRSCDDVRSNMMVFLSLPKNYPTLNGLVQMGPISQCRVAHGGQPVWGRGRKLFRRRVVELLFGWTKHSRQEMSEKKPNMFGFIPGMGRKLQ